MSSLMIRLAWLQTVTFKEKRCFLNLFVCQQLLMNTLNSQQRSLNNLSCNKSETERGPECLCRINPQGS